MSYILDALRKSEAARRSREAPDLLAQTAAPLPPMPADRAPGYAGRPAWAVAALGVSALVAALWLRFAPAGDAPAGVAGPPRDDIGLEAGTEEAGAVDDGSVDTSAVDTSPIGAPESDAETGNPRSLDPGRPPGAIPGMAPVTGPAPAAMPPPAPPAAAGPDRASTRTPSAIAAAPALSAPPPAAREAPASARPGPEPSAAAASRPAAVASAPPPSADGRPVALADIAPDLRRQLPPLRMSMHLWNDVPERRLLVLDGQRLRQGDVIGEVVVERIDRDGAVLAWRGARILLPVE